MRLLLALLLVAGAAHADPPLKKQRKLKWGVYQIHWRGPQFAKQLDKQLALLEGQPSYTMFFRDLHPRRGFPTASVKELALRDITPMLSLELTIWGMRKRKFLPAIVKGDYDAWFERWAKDAKAYGKPVILRFGFEMNGDWFSWGQQPKQFVSAWKRARAIFVKAGATNVKWMFAPNVLWSDKTADKFMVPYWPGADQVDLLGLDGYNFGDKHDKWHAWSAYDTVFEKSIAAITRWKKPLIISEVGCADDKRKAAWVADFLRRVTADTRVEGFVWFNYDKRREGEPDWRLNSDQKTLEVFSGWAERQAALK